MLCLMDVNPNYTCLYSPPCNDCTVAIHLSLLTMFLFILPPLPSLCALLAGECGVCLGGCCATSAELYGCNGDNQAAELIQSEEKSSFSQSFFLCREDLCVFMRTCWSVCKKRDVSTAGLLRLG